MKIEKAIINLSIQLEVKRRLGKNSQADALRLGIEALKRYHELKHQLTFSGMPLLPGETEK